MTTESGKVCDPVRETAQAFVDRVQSCVGEGAMVAGWYQEFCAMREALRAAASGTGAGDSALRAAVTKLRDDAVALGDRTEGAIGPQFAAAVLMCRKHLIETLNAMLAAQPTPERSALQLARYNIVKRCDEVRILYKHCAESEPLRVAIDSIEQVAIAEIDAALASTPPAPGVELSDTEIDLAISDLCAAVEFDVTELSDDEQSDDTKRAIAKLHTISRGNTRRHVTQLRELQRELCSAEVLNAHANLTNALDAYACVVHNAIESRIARCR